MTCRWMSLEEETHHCQCHRHRGWGYGSHTALGRKLRLREAVDGCGPMVRAGWGREKAHSGREQKGRGRHLPGVSCAPGSRPALCVQDPPATRHDHPCGHVRNSRLREGGQPTHGHTAGQGPGKCRTQAGARPSFPPDPGHTLQHIVCREP